MFVARRSGAAQVAANRDAVGARPSGVDAEPRTSSPRVQVGEVSIKPAPATWATPSPTARAGEQQGAVIEYQQVSPTAPRFYMGRGGGERSSSAALPDDSTTFSTRDEHETSMIFRHVPKRPLQRLVRRRRNARVRASEHRDSAGRRNRDGDAEPVTPSPGVLVGEVNVTLVLIVRVAPGQRARAHR